MENITSRGWLSRTSRGWFVTAPSISIIMRYAKPKDLTCSELHSYAICTEPAHRQVLPVLQVINNQSIAYECL